MTDRETLFIYRIKQAEETLFDIESWLKINLDHLCYSVSQNYEKNVEKFEHEMGS